MGKDKVMVDKAFFCRAVESANPHAVRMAPYQATRDPEIAAMPLERIVIRGGATTQWVVTEKHRAPLIDKAVAFSTSIGSTPIEEIEQVPDDATVHRLLEMAENEPVSPGDLEFKRDLPAFEWFPRVAAWHGPRPAAADAGHMADNGWYRALVRDNVERVTDRIERVRADGIVTRPDRVSGGHDHRRRGLRVNKYTGPAECRGVGGVNLHEVWNVKGPRAPLVQDGPHGPRRVRRTPWAPKPAGRPAFKSDVTT